MKLDRLVRSSLLALLFLAAAASLPASPRPQTPQQPTAGKITALIPEGSVLRERKTYEAKKDMAVLWQDTVKTERGGRARLRLEDGTILNVGSQASLVVTKHDPAMQQTDLELIYGKVRADVTKIARPDGHFEIRTKVAVCGVVGTEEYLEATDLATTVIALGGGQVRVSSADARFPGATLLNPGEAISVIAGRAPGPKRLATSEEMTRAVQDTEGESGATIDPGASVAGRTFDAVITGKDLSGTQSVSSTQAGLTVKTRGEITATQIPVTITIAPDVPVGAYPLTINRPQGPAVAGFAVASQTAIQMAQSAGTSLIQPPPSQDFTVTQGAKIPLDASTTRTPPGSQIVAYQWTVPNTPLTGAGPDFLINTSTLAPGSYSVHLTVVNDSGQVATQQYPLVVEAGVKPVEVVRDLASSYDSLQPSAFLKNFDAERFRNYAGFAAAIEDSFQSKLETMRVFQRVLHGHANRRIHRLDQLYRPGPSRKSTRHSPVFAQPFGSGSDSKLHGVCAHHWAHRCEWTCTFHVGSDRARHLWRHHCDRQRNARPSAGFQSQRDASDDLQLARARDAKQHAPCYGAGCCGHGIHGNGVHRFSEPPRRVLGQSRQRDSWCAGVLSDRYQRGSFAGSRIDNRARHAEFRRNQDSHALLECNQRLHAPSDAGDVGGQSCLGTSGRHLAGWRAGRFHFRIRRNRGD